MRFRVPACTAFGLLLGLAQTVVSAKTITVVTANNSSSDSMSLKRALTEAAAGDIIAFNIPGDGPHLIATPPGGYPLIRVSNLTIDGYTQPSSRVNSSPIHSRNNADLRIILDSRRTGDDIAESTPLDFPGFGPSESAVLGVYSANGFSLRGVALLSDPGLNTIDEPSIYGVALVNGCQNTRIQGCWFGVDPREKTFAVGVGGRVAGVFGGEAAVASFAAVDEISGLRTLSSGLIIGTDGDGSGDLAEFNVICGQGKAVHVETPNTRVSGNHINILPNGRVLSPSEAGITGSRTMEFYENGAGDNAVIGIGGDGVGDANEANYIGQVKYDVVIEFWRQASNVTIAGNQFGVDLTGAPAFQTPVSTAFVIVRADSTVRIGSDFNGVSDTLEANRIHGLAGPLVRLHHSNNDPGKAPAVVSFRGNAISNGRSAAPIGDNANVSLARFYERVTTNQVVFRPVFSTNGTTTVTRAVGVIPEPSPNVQGPVRLDFYLADLQSLTNGVALGRTYLGSFEESGSLDLNAAPAQFEFNISSWNLSAADLLRLTATANYTIGGRVSTTPFAKAFGDFAPVGPGGDISLRITPNRPAGTAVIQITGGNPPFVLQRKTDLNQPVWTDFVTTSDRQTTVNLAEPGEFVRAIVR